MTEQEPTDKPTTVTPDATATAEVPSEPEAKDEEDEEDEDDDKKSKKKKKKEKKEKEEKEDDEDDDKPKKVKIEFEATMPRNEAISYFEAIIGGLRSGRLEFKQGDQMLVLNPPDRLEIEVKAQAKGDKGRVVFEIEWSDEHRALEISN
jgi:amphi-Trp domain-containing protein